MAYLSPETRLAMLGIIREARNDLKKWSEEYEAKVRSIKDLKSVSMISCSPSKQKEELNLKKKAENPLTLDGDKSVLLKQILNVCKVVDGRNHQMLARNESSGREMSKNFENSLGNFVEHMVGQKQQKVSMVENPKMEGYHDGFGFQAPLSTSSVTSPLPEKPPDPPDMIHGKSRNKGTIPSKYSCEEMYARMEMGLCVFCEEFDTPGHCQLKHKGLRILVTERDDEEKVENVVVEEIVEISTKIIQEEAITALEAVYPQYSVGVEAQEETVAVGEQLLEASNVMATQVLDHVIGKFPTEIDDDIGIVLLEDNIDFPVIDDSYSRRKSMLLWEDNRQHADGKITSTEKIAERIWEPGGLTAKETQWYWPEKCKSLWFYAATSDMRLMRQLHIQAKELLSEFQDLPRLLVSASEFGPKIHKPPDPNEKLLDDETTGIFIRVKELKADVRFNFVPSKEDYIILESEVKWKLRETSEAEVNYGFHSRWGFTSGRQPRAYLHTAYEKMVCSPDAIHLVDGLRNCMHGFEAECVWDPGGLSAKAAHLDWPETYQNRSSTLKLTSKFHETCIRSLVLLLKPAKEIQAGYELLISNSVKELVATNIRLRLLRQSITDVTVALFSGCGITKGFTEYINWSNEGMQNHTGFSLFGTEMFQVKHKWRYKPFPIVAELELKDEATFDTRNEDMLSCYTTGQAREEVVSFYVEVTRTIEMSQSKAWIFKYNNERQGRDMNETQQQALRIKCGQSRYCREVQKLELTSMAGNHAYINRCFTGFCVNEVFHLQRPPEMFAENDHQRCYDGFSTKFLSSLRTRMFSTREYCNRINLYPLV